MSLFGGGQKTGGGLFGGQTSSSGLFGSSTNKPAGGGTDL